MRHRISKRGCVRPSIRPSVGPSGRNAFSQMTARCILRQVFGLVLSSAGTRLRAPERLLINLQEDEIAQQGFQFPSQTSNELQQALDAMIVQGVATYTDTEEIIDKWDLQPDEEAVNPSHS